jgi:hypothetical protein
LRLLTEPPVLGSEEVIVKVIVWPVVAVVVSSVKPTTGGLFCEIVFVAVELLAVEPELSVAFTETEKVPVAEYA